LTKQDWIESLPYFALAIAMGITTWVVETTHTGASGLRWELGPIARIGIAGRATWFYAAKLSWPHRFSFVYHRWSPNDPVGCLAVLATLGAIAILWAARNKFGRAPLVAFLFFAGTLLPVS